MTCVSMCCVTLFTWSVSNPNCVENSYPRMHLAVPFVTWNVAGTDFPVSD